jgi:DNA-binding Lrp family transcriptional regulator
VLAIWTVSGADDFIVEVAVGEVGDLRDFVLEHVTSRDDVVDARSSIVY